MIANPQPHTPHTMWDLSLVCWWRDIDFPEIRAPKSFAYTMHRFIGDQCRRWERKWHLPELHLSWKSSNDIRLHYINKNNIHSHRKHNALLKSTDYICEMFYIHYYVGAVFVVVFVFVRRIGFDDSFISVYATRHWLREKKRLHPCHQN